MSVRRFAYLVTDDVNLRQFLLRRVDMSRFFFRKRESFVDPPPLEEGRLPPPAMKFMPPLSNGNKGRRMHFMLIPGDDDGIVSNSRTDDKIVAADVCSHTGRSHSMAVSTTSRSTSSGLASRAGMGRMMPTCAHQTSR